MNKNNHIREFLDYLDAKGNNPVQEYLQSLNIRDRSKIEDMIKALKDVEKLGYPYYKLFSGYIVNIGELIIGKFRLFVTKIGREKYLIVHMFRKKTKETPKSEITIALKRILDYHQRSKKNEKK